MEIEVGEYVRTDKGIIAKVDEIRLGTNRKKKIFQNVYELDNGRWTVIDYIIKHSKNIIDLIEVGDYLDILADGSPLRFEVDKIDFKHKLKNIANEIKIRSIVTKEQMASIEYRVKE